jgi:hypothetical protein
MAKKLKTTEQVLQELIYKFGIQTMVLSGLILALKRETPSILDKAIEVLEGFQTPDLTGQGMVDDAILSLRSFSKS